MKIGTVKEIKQHEYRVGITPYNARDYAAAGHTVYIQKGAGEGSFFTDEEYIESGATILDTAEAVWATCDMVVKVKEPLAPEYDLMREGQILYTYLHLAADKPLTEALLAKKVTAIAYETITDKNGGLPLLKPMSEVAGKLSVQAGTMCLEKQNGGRGILLGGTPGVKRGDMVIIGGGIVGTAALKIAVGLGASVTILDNNLDRLSQLDDMFGGSVQTMYSTAANIEAAVKNADLVIGAVLIPGAAAPKLIKREYLKAMRKGSVIVDVAVDQGGCAETTKVTYYDNPTYEVDGVIHYCVANMPGAVSKTSTVALTNATFAYGLKLANMGFDKAVESDACLAQGVNTHAGKLVCKEVADAFGMGWEPLV